MGVGKINTDNSGQPAPASREGFWVSAVRGDRSSDGDDHLRQGAKWLRSNRRRADAGVCRKELRLLASCPIQYCVHLVLSGIMMCLI